MRRFANLADAGAQLAPLVAEALATGTDARVIVLAAIPNGVPVALPVATALGVTARAMPVERTDDGPRIGALPELAGACVVVVDDGVETGSVARAAAAAIGPANPVELVLAVPVCPREAMADLGLRYDRIIAVEQPFGRRSLAWHFDDFDTIDAARAMALLAEA
jgi:predicted phosphoribosyltransferase